MADVAFEQELTPRRLSHEAVRQAVKRLGHGWKRAKTWITSPDPAYARKKARDRLIRLAASHPEWVLGYQDECWWSRLALPAMHAWTAEDDPLRLVERAVPKGDTDPKALSCYGLLRADTGADDAAVRVGPPGQPSDRGLPGVGVRAVGGGGEEGVAAGVGQRRVARQQAGAGVDQGATTGRLVRRAVFGSWRASCR